MLTPTLTSSAEKKPKEKLEEASKEKPTIVKNKYSIDEIMKDIELFMSEET